MINYRKELDDRLNYYLPLVDREDKGKKEVYDYDIPLLFIEQYANLFKCGDSLIKIYKSFNIDDWFRNNMYIDYENACALSSEFESVGEEIDWILEEYNRINFSSRALENYLYLIKRLSSIYIDIFSKDKGYYESLNGIVKNAIEDLKKYNTICYKANKVDNIYQPDAWYILPNGCLYNVGKYGHKGRDLSYNFNSIKRNVNDSNLNNHDTSNGYLNMIRDIKEKGYISAGQFKVFLNYISQPAYLEYIDGIPVTREKHVMDLVLGIIYAKVYFYRFFEDLCINTENPQEELNRLIKMTNGDIRDILVRCCGFHKVESSVEKTITTSCINYETELYEYIKNGWKISFIPPIIINNGILEEYPEDFLKMRMILKKDK